MMGFEIIVSFQTFSLFVSRRIGVGFCATDATSGVKVVVLLRPCLPSSFALEFTVLTVDYG